MVLYVALRNASNHDDLAPVSPGDLGDATMDVCLGDGLCNRLLLETWTRFRPKPLVSVGMVKLQIGKCLLMGDPALNNPLDLMVNHQLIIIIVQPIIQ